MTKIFQPQDHVRKTKIALRKILCVRIFRAFSYHVNHQKCAFDLAMINSTIFSRNFRGMMPCLQTKRTITILFMCAEDQNCSFPQPMCASLPVLRPLLQLPKQDGLVLNVRDHRLSQNKHGKTTCLRSGNKTTTTSLHVRSTKVTKKLSNTVYMCDPPSLTSPTKSIAKTVHVSVLLQNPEQLPKEKLYMITFPKYPRRKHMCVSKSDLYLPWE